MTTREQLLQDGYIVFESVAPRELCEAAATIINATSEGPTFTWNDPVSLQFREWGKAFLESTGLGLHGWSADIHIFNRRPGVRGDGQFWHDDNQHNHPFYQMGPDVKEGRRVFACTYFTDTFNGRAPFRVIPNSHHGGYKDFRIRFTTMRLQMSGIRPPGVTEDYQGDIFADFPDMWGSHPDERVLEVPAGSIVVCDERMLHGTPMNTTTERRPMALWWLEKDPHDRILEPDYAEAFFANANGGLL